MNIYKKFFIIFVVALCLAPAVMGAVTFTSTPGDISFCVNTWGFADLNWYVQSDTNGTGDYWIYRNGSLWANGDWYNRSDIDHEVWTSETGTWNYTVVVNDIDGNVSDTAMVTSEMCCCFFDWIPLWTVVSLSIILLGLSIWHDDSILYLVSGVSWILSFYVSMGLDSRLTDFDALPLFFIVIAFYCFFISLQVLSRFGWRKEH